MTELMISSLLQDNRRLPNGMNWRLVTGAALRHAKSQTWAGYWQRAAA